MFRKFIFAVMIAFFGFAGLPAVSNAPAFTDSSVVSAFVTAPAEAKNKKDRLGDGSYYIVRTPDFIRHVQGLTKTTWTTTEFDQLQDIDAWCKQELKDQTPSWFKEVGLTAVRNIPGAALGTGLGALLGFGSAIDAGDYILYGAGAAGGSSIGAGLTARSYGKRYDRAGCVVVIVNDLKKQGMFRGINVVYNAHAVNGKSLKRPTGPASEDTILTPHDEDAASDNSTNDAAMMGTPR